MCDFKKLNETNEMSQQNIGHLAINHRHGRNDVSKYFVW